MHGAANWRERAQVPQHLDALSLTVHAEPKTYYAEVDAHVSLAQGQKLYNGSNEFKATIYDGPHTLSHSDMLYLRCA